MQQKAFVKLLGLHYKVLYKKGLENKVVDALSRQQEGQLHAIFACTPKWLETVIESYQHDSTTQQLLQETGSNDKGYTLVNGVIRHKGRIWLGNHTEAHEAVMLALHTNGLGGHSGVTVTYHKIRALFSWPNMKHDITQFSSKYEVCAKAKSEHNRLPGLLQPLPIPEQSWHTVSLDFIEGLPKSKTFDTILVVIDKFSKYAHFIPLSHPYTTLTVAQVYLNNIYKLHGLPQIIVSDRDRVFTSAVWQELFRLTHTTLNTSSSYHPQTGGQTERLNQCLETYLRCMIHDCPTKWFQWLPLAEYWYNTTYHSAHGTTPFEVLYGNKPRHFGITTTDTCSVPDLQQWLQDRSAMTQLIQQHLARAQQRMKFQADKQRSEREFAVGDWVYLKLQPHVQHSVARRTCAKLNYKYFGSYLILQRIGAVAYKLQLPPSSKIHQVVHVSQLKKAIPPDSTVTPDEHLSLLLTETELTPVQVLCTKLCLVGQLAHPFALVQWSFLPVDWTSWVNMKTLHNLS
jgi:hypothetical protein